MEGINVNGVIVEIFPTTIYMVDNCCDHLIVDLEKSSKEEIQKNSLQTDTFNVRSSHRFFNDLDYYPFDALRQFINYHAVIYLNTLGYETDNRKLNINLWCNISDEGGFLFPHTHSGSLISGVFYVKSSEDDQIIFYNNHRLISNIPVAKNRNQYSAESVSYKCNKGSLLMWTSDCIHGNPKRHSKEEKIAISFNITIF